MDRRNFLRTMLGVAAATALPSEVWPFRKIFLPAEPQIMLLQKRFDDITALELEYYAKAIPDMVFRTTPLYDLLKKRKYMRMESTGFRIPAMIRPGDTVFREVEWNDELDPILS